MLEPSAASDLRLVRRVLAKDRDALRELGSRLENVPRLIAAANRRLARPLPPHELSDLSQDTIVMIWEKLETFEGRSTLEGWAWRFGLLELRNRVRAVARRRQRDGASLADLELDPPAPKPEAMRFDPDELDRALDRLPADMAEVVRLKHDDGLMFKEIAARLRIPENTAKTRYYRALARMKALLETEQSGRNDPPSAP